MRKYRYTLQAKDGRTKVTLIGHAFSLQMMLAKIENERSLELWRVIEIKELQR